MSNKNTPKVKESLAFSAKRLNANSSAARSPKSTYRTMSNMSIMDKPPKRILDPVYALDDRIEIGRRKQNSFGYGHGFPIEDDQLRQYLNPHPRNPLPPPVLSDKRHKTSEYFNKEKDSVISSFADQSLVSGQMMQMYNTKTSFFQPIKFQNQEVHRHAITT